MYPINSNFVGVENDGPKRFFLLLYRVWFPFLDKLHIRTHLVQIVSLLIVLWLSFCGLFRQ